MLNDGLARAERPRDTRRTSLRDWEKGIYRTDTRYHQILGCELYGVRTRDTHGPLLHKCDIRDGTVGIFDLSYPVVYMIVTRLYLDDRSRHTRRNDYLMTYDLGLLYRAVDISGFDLVSEFQSRLKVPYLISVKCGFVNTAGKVRAVSLAYDLKRTLDAVIYVLKQSGSEFYRKRRARRYDGIPSSESRSLLIDLYRGAVAVHFDYFSDKFFIRNSYNVEKFAVCHIFGDYKRPRNFNNFSLHFLFTFLVFVVEKNIDSEGLIH